MTRYRTLLPLAALIAAPFAAGCGSDVPTVVTDANTAAQQEAAQKKADEEERNMKDGAYDPDAPKKPGKKR